MERLLNSGGVFTDVPTVNNIFSGSGIIGSHDIDGDSVEDAILGYNNPNFNYFWFKAQPTGLIEIGELLHVSKREPSMRWRSLFLRRR